MNFRVVSNFTFEKKVFRVPDVKLCSQSLEDTPASRTCGGHTFRISSVFPLLSSLREQMLRIWYPLEQGVWGRHSGCLSYIRSPPLDAQPFLVQLMDFGES